MLHASLKSNNYSNKDAIQGVTHYILGEHNECGLFGATGLLCSTPDDMIASMQQLKNDFKKPHGRQLLHLVISFDAADSLLLTPEMVLELGYLFANQLIGFQTIFSVHNNTEYLHLHYVINSVNYCTGYKIALSYQEIHCHYQPLFNQILNNYKKEKLGIDSQRSVSIEEFLD